MAKAKRKPQKKAKKSSQREARKPSQREVQKPDQWPLPRRVFFRPERMKYVRKLVKEEGCVFCKAASTAIGFESLCVRKTPHSMIVLNKYPYNSGHLLVLPLRHVADLTELSPDEFADLHLTLREAMTALKAVYEPAALNIGMNHGRVAGAGIPDHIHYHLVPRWAGDLNFFPLIAETKLVIESLETTFERLLGYFKKESKKS